MLNAKHFRTKYRLILKGTDKGIIVIDSHCIDAQAIASDNWVCRGIEVESVLLFIQL